MSPRHYAIKQMKNPFIDKSDEEALEMFIESPSHETKKLHVYSAAVNVKSAQGVRRSIDGFTKVADRISNQLESLNKNITEHSRNTTIHGWVIAVFTLVLVAVGVTQAAIATQSSFVERSAQEARKTCFRTALQTSDIDVAFKNCLRSNGLAE